MSETDFIIWYSLTGAFLAYISINHAIEHETSTISKQLVILILCVIAWPVLLIIAPLFNKD